MRVKLSLRLDDHLLSLPDLRERIRRNRADAESLHALGLLLAARGEYRRSFIYHRAAAGCRPNDATYVYGAGGAALAVGRAGDAASFLDRALGIEPANAQAWQKRGELYLDHFDKPDDALRCYVKAIALAPDDRDHYKSAARCVLNGQGATGAIAHLRAAIPAGMDPWNADRGVALAFAEVGDYEAAAPILCDIVRQCPGDHTSMRVLAELHTGLHDWNAAQSWYERAIAGGKDPLAAIGYLLHWSRLGDFERARHFYRSYMQDAAFDNILMPARRRWGGHNLQGKTLRLVVGDIYFGDALHFARFARIAKEYGAKVILQAPKRLRSLLLTVEGVDAVIAPHDRTPPTDYDAQAFWTMYALPIPVADMIGRVPYLKPPVDLLPGWRARIAPSSGLNIGIAWRGSAFRIRDRFGSRSMRLENLRPLSNLPGVTLYSLQCGEGRTELLKANPSFPAIDLAPDFPNTAAAIEALDLIVTVDTSIAHLAGALGKRTFLMLPYDACFRWMVNRDDTPWYPSVRLFRQTRPGEWSDVVNAVARALQP